MVEEIKKKGHDIIKRKRGVPGIDMVQEQLTELGKVQHTIEVLHFKHL